jgi:hypothetical protein
MIPIPPVFFMLGCSWIWTRLLADSGCSRNAAEFSRVSSEEVLQSLRTTSRDGADCIGNAASLFISPSF